MFFLLVLVLALGAASAQAPAASLISAQSLYKQGKFGEAAAAYKGIVEKDKSSAPAYAGLVQSYLKADEVGLADQISSAMRVWCRAISKQTKLDWPTKSRQKLLLFYPSQP